MKIVMMGTGPFAVPTFKTLLASSQEIVCLVTRPDAGKPNSRNKIVNPMREVALECGLTVHDPINVNAESFVEQLSEFNADLFVVCDYGQILSRQCLAAARLGGINLHGSLLPKYRGAAPINWAIYHGELETGVTVIHMTSKLDGGPMLTQRVTAIGSRDTAVDLEPRMAESGVNAVLDSIEMLQAWDGESSLGTMQHAGQATRAPRLTKTDGQIDWTRTARQIANQIRAFKPWPGTYCNWQKIAGDTGDEPVRLIIHEASALDQPSRSKAGFVEQVSPDSLQVAAQNSILEIYEIQPAGKRQMKVADFLRGNPVQVGDRMV